MSLKIKRQWPLLGVLLVVAGLLAGGAKTVPIATAGRVTYATGIANVRKSQLVGPGYRLRTGHNGRVELTFSNGHKLRVGPKSDLQLVAYRPQQKQTMIQVNQGRTWNKVPAGQGNKVITRTKYSTASVLGTVFDTSVGTAEASTTVIEGSVGVRGPETLPEQSLFEQLPPLPAATPVPVSNSLQPPTQIANPVHQVELPIRVVPGPYEVNRDEWLQLVANQRISLGASGKATVSIVSPTQLKDADEWYRWNLQMDAQAQ